MYAKAIKIRITMRFKKRELEREDKIKSIARHIETKKIDKLSNR